MSKILDMDFEDYPRLLGISAANIGLTLNVLSIRHKSSRIDMINPTITKMSRKTRTLQSNCGSLNLPARFPVVRREWVEVSYYDTKGKHHQDRFKLGQGGATIQHEIDHNRGVLITDTHKHM